MPNGDGSHRRVDADLSGSRWRGVIDTRLAGVEDWVRDLDRKQAQAEKDQAEKREQDQREMAIMKAQLAQLFTKVGMWAAIGSILGAAIIEGVVKNFGGH